jgi:hypothetical protein
MATPKNDGRWRRIAGSLELFLGSYFAACGCLAILFFITLENRDGVLLSALAVLIGMLLVFRAGHLLAWRPWIFRTVAFLMILAPIAWVTPAFLTASVETSAARHRSELAANIRVRSVKAYDLAPVDAIKRFSPAVPDNKYAKVGARWAVTARDNIQSVTADTFVWCMEKVQSFMHHDDEQRR